MQWARRRCRWCCRTPGNEPDDFPFSNEEIRHLCEAICLIASPPRSVDIFDAFNFFDLDTSSLALLSFKFRDLRLARFGVRPALFRLEETILKISPVLNSR